MTTTLVEEGQTPLSLEGPLPGDEKAWAMFTLHSESAVLDTGVLAGTGRTLNDDGVLLAEEISGVWSRERAIHHSTTLDQVSNGDQSSALHELTILTKEISVKAFNAA